MIGRKKLILLHKADHFYLKRPNLRPFKTLCISRLKSAKAESNNLLTILALVCASSALDAQSDGMLHSYIHRDVFHLHNHLNSHPDSPQISQSCPLVTGQVISKAFSPQNSVDVAASAQIPPGKGYTR